MVKRKAETYLTNEVGVEATHPDLGSEVAAAKEGGVVTQRGSKEVGIAPKAATTLTAEVPVVGNGLEGEDLDLFWALLIRVGYEVW